MSAFLPLPGGFIKLAERFVDRAFAFAIGWNYWYSWTVRSLCVKFTPALTLAMYTAGPTWFVQLNMKVFSY